MSKYGKGVAALLILAVAASAGWVWFNGHSAPGQILEIYQNGQLVETVNLTQSDQPRTIVLEGDNGVENTVLIQDGQVCMSHATCPDQVCVNQGWISDGAVPIVCLPNQVILQIKGGGGALDAIAG